MKIAKYIIDIFKHYPCVVMSWGFHNAVAIEDGIVFRVQGYLFKGTVKVVYDNGSDTFTVRLLTANGSIKKEVEDVYIDCLVDVIDGLVERCENYADRVKSDYHCVQSTGVFK